MHYTLLNHCTKLGQTFKGCVGGGDFSPGIHLEAVLVFIFGKGNFGVAGAVSRQIGMKIYIATEDNLAELLSHKFVCPFRGASWVGGRSGATYDHLAELLA